MQLNEVVDEKMDQRPHDKMYGAVQIAEGPEHMCLAFKGNGR